MRPAPRPKHPDGTKYRFNCCAYPDVCVRMPDPEKSEREIAECNNCGHDWTDQCL